MFVSTNRIRISKDHSDELEERFKPRGGVEQNPGFVDFELWKLNKDADHEEYLVVTHWESEDAFKAWTQSDSFRQAHSGPPLEGLMGHGEFNGYDVLFSTRDVETTAERSA